MNGPPPTDTRGAPAPAPALPGRLGMDSISLTDAQAQALLRLVETSSKVHRRPQFFNWMQLHFPALIPHVLVVCGAYDRELHRVVFEVFHSLVMPKALLDALTDNASALMVRITRTWIEGQGQPFSVELAHDIARALGTECPALRRAGLTRIAVHGVARPKRIHELETFFMFGDAAPHGLPGRLHHFELVLPHLHATYLRMHGLERELSGEVPRPGAKAGDGLPAQLSKRERQILHWVREGMTNQQIGEVLSISPLTVKNHVQKILRKLGATNRAHAVATAMRAQARPDAGTMGAAPPASGAGDEEAFSQ